MKRLENVKVVMSRAPMTAPSVMNVRVIRDGDPYAEFIEEDTAYISPIGTVNGAGDCDGDVHTFSYVEGSPIQLDTLDSIKQQVIERTGSDQLVPGGAYWGDHYNIASAATVTKKRKISNKNLSLSNSGTRQSLPVMLEGSTEMFQSAVGWVHRLFLTTDIYLNILWSTQDRLQEIFPDWHTAEFASNKSLVLILAEMYEVPLGGLSWEAYEVIFDWIVPILQGKLSKESFDGDSIAKFEEALNAGDMNGAAAKDVLHSAFLVAACRNIGQTSQVDKFFDSPEGFIRISAELASLISKGQLDFTNEPHQNLIELFKTWVVTFDAELNIISSNVTLMQLHEFLSTVAVAAAGDVPEIDLSYFDFD